MNPPTPGHLELIREMLTMAKNKGIKQIYIFLSEKQGPKDPISCADKVTALNGFYDPVANINIWANVAEFVRDSMINSDNIDQVTKANDAAVLARNAANAAATNTNIQPKLKSMIQSLKTDMGIDITVNTICFSGSSVFKYIDYYANNLAQLQIPPNNPKSVYLVGFFGGDRDDFGVAIEKSFKNKYSYYAPPSSPRAGMEKFKNLNPEFLLIDNGQTGYYSMANIVNAGAMSASLVRLIVQQGHTQNPDNNAKFKARFTELYQPYLDSDSIDKLYDAINWGMVHYTAIEAEAKASKRGTKRKLGGRKTRKVRKTRKSRKTQKSRKTRRKRSTK